MAVDDLKRALEELKERHVVSETAAVGSFCLVAGLVGSPPVSKPFNSSAWNMTSQPACRTPISSSARIRSTFQRLLEEFPVKLGSLSLNLFSYRVPDKLALAHVAIKRDKFLHQSLERCWNPGVYPHVVAFTHTLYTSQHTDVSRSYTNREIPATVAASYASNIMRKWFHIQTMEKNGKADIGMISII